MLRKPCASERPRLAPHLLRRERHAQDGVVARKAAVLAVVDALVGEIERRKEANDLAEALLRHLLRAPGQRLQQLRPGRGNQVRKVLQRQLEPCPGSRAPPRVDAVSERWTRAASGSVLNSVTKLTS